jgi:hypothetical protein
MKTDAPYNPFAHDHLAPRDRPKPPADWNMEKARKAWQMFAPDRIKSIR